MLTNEHHTSRELTYYAEALAHEQNTGTVYRLGTVPAANHAWH